MGPERLAKDVLRRFRLFHIVLIFIMQIIVNILFIMIISNYLIDRRMHDHEYRDKVQDMRINNLASVISEKLHVNTDNCGNCHLR